MASKSRARLSPAAGRARPVDLFRPGPGAAQRGCSRRTFLSQLAAGSGWLMAGAAALAPSAALARSPSQQLPLKARVSEALQRAAAALLACQDADGLWRSTVYGPFADGLSLSPLILRSLAELPENTLWQQPLELGTFAIIQAAEGLPDSAAELNYPIYTATNATVLLATRPHSARSLACEAWRAAVEQRQLNESLGWQPSDVVYGGWGYAKSPPYKPADASQISPLAESNLSATVFALEALRRGGLPVDHAAYAQAVKFIARCQNWPEEGQPRDAQYDDGGCYFLHDDVVRNKAGEAGRDAQGRVRFASYGSTTAEGLRGMLLCGLPVDHPRVRGAHHWLCRHFDPEKHPGKYAPQRVHARDALYYYYHWSLARAWRASPQLKGPEHWAERLCEALLARQPEDGLWRNPAVDVREDDPFVATPLAMGALMAAIEIAS